MNETPLVALLKREARAGSEMSKRTRELVLYLLRKGSRVIVGKNQLDVSELDQLKRILLEEMVNYPPARFEILEAAVMHGDVELCRLIFSQRAVLPFIEYRNRNLLLVACDEKKSAHHTTHTPSTRCRPFHSLLSCRVLVARAGARTRLAVTCASARLWK
jgi:hypothetical protein